MKKIYIFIAIILVSGVIACNNSSTEKSVGTTPPSDQLDGAALIAKNDCGTCHTAETKIVGPAFKEIAAKYPNTPENVAALATKVVAGGGGVWGNTPMGAHPTLAKADAEKMVSYILDMGAKK